LKEKVEMNKEMAVQSKRLATIMTDVPVKINPDELGIKEWNRDALKELFAELEFRRLGEQIGLTTPTQSSAPKPAAEKEKKAVPGKQSSLFFTNAPDTKVAYSLDEN